MIATTERSKTVSATEARVHLGELLRIVAESDAHIVIQRGGDPAAVILSFAEYNRLTAKPLSDWWEVVLASQRAFAGSREQGILPDVVEMIRDEREKRDAQLLDNLLRR